MSFLWETSFQKEIRVISIALSRKFTYGLYKAGKK
jgi:hypothetical protein